MQIKTENLEFLKTLVSHPQFIVKKPNSSLIVILYKDKNSGDKFGSAPKKINVHINCINIKWELIKH